MIVQESDLLVAALDRRLQVDRTLPPDAVAALTGSAADDTPASARSAAGQAASASGSGLDPASLAARLPLGNVVAAVVASVDEQHVIADVDQWRFALTWPAASGAAPRAGDAVRLLVLAHQPSVVFQLIDAADETDATRNAPAVRWSRSALELARTTGTDRPSEKTVATTRRFTTPILRIDADENETVSHGATAHDDAAASASGVPRANVAGASLIVAPVVLQGPAWVGQPVELVVRRERADDELDNPVLDQWCGEIAIDLPHLGRVAGHLALSMRGLRVRLEGDDAAAVTLMTASSTELAAALGERDFRVQALAIGCRFPRDEQAGNA